MGKSLADIVSPHKYVLDHEKDQAWKVLTSRSFGFQSFLRDFSREGGRAVGRYLSI